MLTSTHNAHRGCALWEPRKDSGGSDSEGVKARGTRRSGNAALRMAGGLSAKGAGGVESDTGAGSRYGSRNVGESAICGMVTSRLRGLRKGSGAEVTNLDAVRCLSGRFGVCDGFFVQRGVGRFFVLTFSVDCNLDAHARVSVETVRCRTSGLATNGRVCGPIRFRRDSEVSGSPGGRFPEPAGRSRSKREAHVSSRLLPIPVKTLKTRAILWFFEK